MGSRPHPCALGSGLMVVMLGMGGAVPADAQHAPRARELGIVPGVLPPGRNNAITDVGGVRVGQTTLVQGDSVRTGVTAVVPHSGNLFFDRVPAATHVGNGFGKLIGVTQLSELGELETPILLTCTLCVWKAADAMAAYLLDQPGMEEVRSINPVVGETNDGYVLNAIRSRPVSPAAVKQALVSAASGPVKEGSVGAGTGTIAFGWKGGIGTSSRLARASGDTAWTVGVLVQSNFGGELQILGVPVGRLLGRSGAKPRVDAQGPHGSIMMVVATDAPLSDRNLRRLAGRAMLGLGKTGSAASNGSGDYVIAFSTHPAVRRHPERPRHRLVELSNEEMSVLFQATVEATEEAIYNSMLTASTMSSRRGTVEALPVPEVLRIMRSHRAIR